MLYIWLVSWSVSSILINIKTKSKVTIIGGGFISSLIVIIIFANLTGQVKTNPKKDNKQENSVSKEKRVADTQKRRKEAEEETRTNKIQKIEDSFAVNDPHLYQTKKGYIFSPELGVFAMATVYIKNGDKKKLYDMYEKKLVSLTSDGLKVKIVAASKNKSIVKIKKLGSNKTVWTERDALVQID
ncbi:hypothetical protein [Candidatus Venteria ishoeyi]|uniref:Uncharacterized protein n=1 Tax=Candidatus Venteria ishoeyi TaxID=1899563 RepID=A0A1H6FF89_9GAMM|nr:hypothetical protein [Candidatus Venteria ishoeyi]SEH07836.1 Uncharacterised protein [Candidatus Venteria ishoeyi]